jgi:site-specific recombinase XerD
VYSSAVEAFQAWLAQNGHPTEARKIEKQHVEGFIAHLLASGRKPTTAHNRYRALNTFFGWLVDEGVVKVSPTQRVEPPIVPPQPTEVISLPVLKRLLRSLEGRGFRDRRDNAMIRLLLDSGMRREELAALKVTDLDLDQQCAYVMGKGRRPRRCPFGKQTALALDRYLRARDQHPRADSPAL